MLTQKIINLQKNPFFKKNLTVTPMFRYSGAFILNKNLGLTP